MITLVREGPLPPVVVPDVRLVPERVIRGRLVDTGGAPVAGARVSAVGHYRVRPGMAFPDRAEARSDAAGRFELRGLRSDVGQTLRCSAAGYATLDLQIPASSGPAFDCGDLRLAAAIDVRGLALDAQGQPVEGARIVAAELERTASEPPDAVLFPRDAAYGLDLSFTRSTDAGGSCTFGELRAGTWRFTLEAGGRLWVREEHELVPGPPLELVLELPPDAPVLEGRVLHEGAPVAGATVVLAAGSRRRTVTSDADGRFRAAGVEAGAAHELTAFATGPGGRQLASDPRSARADEPVVLELGLAAEADPAAAPR